MKKKQFVELWPILLNVFIKFHDAMSEDLLGSGKGVSEGNIRNRNSEGRLDEKRR